MDDAGKASSIIELIAWEAEKAQARYGSFASAHEALGVLFEEFAELAEAVRGHSIKAVLREAAQVAAVALRLAEHCQTETESFKERSQLW